MTLSLSTKVSELQQASVSTESLINQYKRIRQDSENICEPLAIEDYGIQTVPEVSPAKWHLAHTSWFFETLILKAHLKKYQAYHPLYEQLFNSYYDTIGEYHPRPERGLLSRPTVKEVYDYRHYVDEQMLRLLESGFETESIEALTTLGLNHEQQHQELMLTDIKHIFAYNPLKPRYRELPVADQQITPQKQWLRFDGGIVETGFAGEGFAYDNEGPRHKSYLEPFQLCSHPVTNAEYIKFIESGAYKNPELWLSDAWKTVNNERWTCPLYWQQRDQEYWSMSLAGMQKVDSNAPVTHVSFYEAAAYAKWAGARLPSETEWEVAAAGLQIQGNFRDTGFLTPIANQIPGNAKELQQMFGDVWEWTQSAYASYPGYQQAQGALGEYNGKFMSSQMVLRGGSCVTPIDHIRRTYRNFFYPWERWQFTGIRLAKDI